MNAQQWISAVFLAIVPASVGATEIPETIPQVMLPAPELSRYSATALTNPALNARLSGPGPVTAFAPRNHTPASGWAGPVWPTDPEMAARAARGMVFEGHHTPETLRAQAQKNANHVFLRSDTGAEFIVVETPSGPMMVVDRDGNTARMVGPARPAGNGAVIVLDRPIAVR